MTQHRILSILAPGVLAALSVTACRDGARATARADEDGAQARATAGEGEYDPQDNTATGVYIDPKIARACGVQSPNTFFSFDSADLKPGARDTLERVADCLESGALRGNEVVLVGHADPRGSDEYNEELGMSRAEAVAAFLRRSGVPKTRIETESAGERGASDDASTWPRDRRVDIVLDADNKKPRR
jgi:peptidoglycan-associated lipoprotein